MFVNHIQNLTVKCCALTIPIYSISKNQKVDDRILTRAQVSYVLLMHVASHAPI